MLITGSTICDVNRQFRIIDEYDGDDIESGRRVLISTIARVI